VGAVGNAFLAFSRVDACCASNPSGSFHRPRNDLVTIAIELGHLVESAVRDLRGERRGQTRASARWTVRDIQWEVALRAPVQG
jgi:hypothetical protein